MSPAVLFRAWPLQWGLEVTTGAAAATLGIAPIVLDMTGGGVLAKGPAMPRFTAA